MNAMTDWYRELVEAAADLGYIVESVSYVSPGQVVLTPAANISVSGDRVIFEGLFTTGRLLRERLQPLRAAVKP